jgi:hypothetical protein
VQRHKLTAKAIFGDFGLFTLVAIMQGDDCSRGPIGGIYHVRRARLYDDVFVVVPPMDFESLWMRRFIVDKDGARHCVLVIPRLV